MQKYLLILFTLILILSGCGANVQQPETKNVGYTINEKVIKNGGTEILYPEIESGNKDVEAKVNKLIADEIDKIRKNYLEYDGLNLEISYEVIWATDKLLSVVYSGYSYVQENPYPTKIIFADNIDMNSGEKIALSDVVTVDNSFAEALQNGNSEDIDLEQQKFIEQMSDDDLLNQLQRDDTYFYISEEYIGIFLEVPHVLGDYIELKCRFEVLDKEQKQIE